MALFWLINPVNVGTVRRLPGDSINDAIDNVSAIQAAGGLLWPQGNATVDAAAARAASERVNRGANEVELESIMQSAVNAVQKAEEASIVPSVATLADLAAASTSNEEDGARCRVRSVDQDFELDKTSTASTDGITIIAALDGGRWIRCLTASAKWSQQTNWFVAALTGNDEATGASGFSVKTVAEACRRLVQQRAGVNYQVKLTEDVPMQEAAPRALGTVVVKDTWRPNGVFDQNREDVSGSTGYEQTFNMTLSGQDLTALTPIATGTLLAFAATSGNVQNTITVAPGELDAYVGMHLMLTSGANTGAVAGIVASLGAGVYRMGRFFSTTNAQINPAGTETYSILQLTKWGPPIIQVGNGQGRYIVQNLEIPNVAAPPAEQGIVTYRYANLSWSRVRFRRNVTSNVAGTNGVVFEISQYANTGLTACIFDYSGLTGQGIGGTGIVAVTGYAVGVFSGCCFINAEIRPFIFSDLRFNSCVIQGGRVASTINPSTVQFYGFFSAGAAMYPPCNTVLQGQGLTIYDWPVSGVDDFAMKIAGGSICSVNSGANLGGTNATAGSIGLRVDSGGKFFWRTAGATAPTITGALADLRVEDSATAMQPIESWAGVAQANYPRPVPLATWADWAAAVALDPGTGAAGSGFGRRVMNYSTGSCVAQVP